MTICSSSGLTANCLSCRDVKQSGFMSGNTIDRMLAVCHFKKGIWLNAPRGTLGSSLSTFLRLRGISAMTDNLLNGLCPGVRVLINVRGRGCWHDNEARVHSCATTIKHLQKLGIHQSSRSSWSICQRYRDHLSYFFSMAHEYMPSHWIFWRWHRRYYTTRRKKAVVLQDSGPRLRSRRLEAYWTRQCSHHMRVARTLRS